MINKKAETKFTIQFSRTDVEHLYVVDILNQLGRSFKAQYIVNAILYYDNRDVLEAQRPEPDEKYIEAIVNRLLRDRADKADNGTGALSAGVSAGQIEKPPQTNTNAVYDKAVEALGQDSFNAIAGSLNMFRKK